MMCGDMRWEMGGRRRRLGSRIKREPTHRRVVGKSSDFAWEGFTSMSPRSNKMTLFLKTQDPPSKTFFIFAAPQNQPLGFPPYGKQNV